MAFTPEEQAAFQELTRGGPRRPSTPADADVEAFNRLVGKPTIRVPGPQQAKSIGDSLTAGMQASSLGLAMRAAKPDMLMPEDAPWYHRFAAGVSGVVGDLPATVLGAGAGMAATRNPLGAFVGGFAVPMAVREGLMEAYGHDNATSWAGAWEIAKASGVGFGKGAAIGAATMAGGAAGLALVGKTAVAAAAPTLVKGGAQLAGELAGMTTTAAALEGHLPTWQNFMDNAILLGGFKGAVHIASRLRTAYVETGRRPEEVVLDAQKDKSIKDWLETGDLLGEVPEAYRVMAFNERVRAALDDPRSQDAIAATVAEAAGKTKDLTGDLVRYEYITDNATAEAVIRVIAEASKESIEAHRRGVVPTKETIADAARALAEGKIEGHVRGEADAPHVATARAMLTKDAAIRAATFMKELADTPAELRTPQQRLAAHAAMEQVGMFYKQLVGGVAEAARTVRMMGEIKRNPEILGEAMQMLRVYEQNHKNVDMLAAMMESIKKDPAALAEFIRETNRATTLEKIIYVWRAGALSGIHTTGANLLGNVGRVLADIPDSIVSASITAGKQAIKGDPLTLQQYKARAFAPFLGWQLGWRDAFSVAKQVWQMKGEALEKMDLYRRPIDSPTAALPYRWLQVQDAFFRTPAERAEAFKIAVDRVAKEGLDPRTTEYMDTVKLYTDRPQLGLSEKAAQKVTLRIEKAGSESVFADKLGPRAEFVQRAISGSPMQFIVPFWRTPVNLLSYAMQHIPGLNFLSKRWWDDFNAGGELRSRAIARVSAGAAMGAGFMALASHGVITDGGLFDREQGGTKRGAKWQPYSFLIDGKYYSYQRMEPIGKMIGVAADLVGLLNTDLPPEEKGKIAYMLVAMLGNATVSTTYMSGLSNAMEAVTDPERGADTFIESLAGSLVPRIIGQTVGMFDPFDREVDGVVEAIQKQLPFWRTSLLPKVDVWGEPVERGTWFHVLPVATSEASKDKVKTEAMRLQFAIADAPDFVMEKGPFKPKDKRTEQTQEQKNVFKVVTGKFAMSVLAPIVNHPDWESLPDYAQRDAYRQVFEAARKLGTEESAPAMSPEREAMRQRILDRINEEAKQAQKRSTR